MKTISSSSKSRLGRIWCCNRVSITCGWYHNVTTMQNN